MKCTADWELYDPQASVMCSVCIEEYSGFNNGYGSNGYTQMGYTGYGFNNNSYTNGYINMGYNGTEVSGKYCSVFCFPYYTIMLVQFEKKVKF